jgi:hypothetical protein
MVPSRGTYLARAVKATLGDPGEAVEKIRERAADRWERAVRGDSRPRSAPAENWEQKLHKLLGADWPCAEAAAFPSAWAAAKQTMSAHGLSVGRQNYGDDDDADPGLARTLWCLVHHLQAENVVETGVAHGLSSRVMLEALKRTGSGEGHLSSIDRPAMTIDERRAEIGAAVTDELRGRWTYLEGASRRRLPPLLRRLGQIDLFVHDSLHSTRNVHWELDTAWKALRPGGFVVVDDVDFNWGFELFLAAGLDRDPLWCMADDGQRSFAIARKLAPGEQPRST